MVSTPAQLSELAKLMQRSGRNTVTLVQRMTVALRQNVFRETILRNRECMWASSDHELRADSSRHLGWLLPLVVDATVHVVSADMTPDNRLGEGVTSLIVLSGVERIDFPRAWTRCVLPRSLKFLGEEFWVAQQCVDLRHKRIGDRFHNGNRYVQEVHLPLTLKTVGVCFCHGSAIRTLDFSATQLTELPAGFCSACSELCELSLPATLERIESQVLWNLRLLTSIDLSHTNVRSIGNIFLARALRLAEVRFPPTLVTIGEGFCRTSSIGELDLSATPLKELPHNFCAECSDLRKLSLPLTLERIGCDVLRNLKHLTSIDLSHTNLRSIGDEFLAETTHLAEVRLPPTLATIGEGFCRSSDIRELDLSKTQLTELPAGFCENCPKLRTVLLPPMLKRVESAVLERLKQLPDIDPLLLRVTLLGSTPRRSYF